MFFVSWIKVMFFLLQEVYWRIPGVWNSTALKKRIDFLSKLLNNEDPLPADTLETTRYSDPDSDTNDRTQSGSENYDRSRIVRETRSDSSDEDVEDGSTRNNHTAEHVWKSGPVRTDSGNETSESEDDSKSIGGSDRKKTKKSGRAVLSGSSDDESIVDTERDSGRKKEKKRNEKDGNAKEKKRAKKSTDISKKFAALKSTSALDSDSSDFGDLESPRKQKNKSTVNVNTDSDSDEERPSVGKARNRIESESEDDELPTIQKKTQNGSVKAATTDSNLGKIDLTKGDSDSNDDQSGKTAKSTKENGKTSVENGKAKKKRVVVIDSSDEDGETNVVEDNAERELDETLSGSRNDKASTKKKAVIISSESEDEVLVKKKTVAVISSESEDDLDKVNKEANSDAMDVDSELTNSNDRGLEKKRLTDSDSDSEMVVEKAKSKKKKEKKKNKSLDLESDDEQPRQSDSHKKKGDKNKQKDKKSKNKSLLSDDDDGLEETEKASAKRKARALDSEDSESDDDEVRKSEARVEEAKQRAAEVKKKMKSVLYSSDSDETVDNNEESNDSTKHWKQNRIVDSEDESPTASEEKETKDGDIENTEKDEEINDEQESQKKGNKQSELIADTPAISQEINSDTIDSQDVEGRDVSFKETIRLDTEQPDNDSENTNLAERTDNDELESTPKVTIQETSEKTSEDISLEKGDISKVSMSKDTAKTKATEVSNINEEIENSSLAINSIDNKRMDSNIKEADKVKRSSEVYSDEDNDEIVKKVKRRKVIVEDDDD